jgi:hypothetical protein
MIDYTDCLRINGKTTKDVKPLFLSKSIEHCKIKKGVAMEFGVASGQSLKLIAEQTKLLTFGFDSWDGLPTDWNVGDTVYKKGHFKTPIPDSESIGKNVILVKGLFDNSLPCFVKSLDFVASFIHIDCDLYASAWSVLDNLNEKIVPGTVIAFDEIENFADTIHKNTNTENEKRAFLDWLKKYNRKVSPICTTNWYQASFQVIN